MHPSMVTVKIKKDKKKSRQTENNMVIAAFDPFAPQEIDDDNANEEYRQQPMRFQEEFSEDINPFRHQDVFNSNVAAKSERRDDFPRLGGGGGISNITALSPPPESKRANDLMTAKQVYNSYFQQTTTVESKASTSFDWDPTRFGGATFEEPQNTVATTAERPERRDDSLPTSPSTPPKDKPESEQPVTQRGESESPTSVVHGPGTRCLIQVEEPEANTKEQETDSNVDEQPRQLIQTEESKESTFTFTKSELMQNELNRMRRLTTMVSSVTRLFIDELDDSHFHRVVRELNGSQTIIKLIVLREVGEGGMKRTRSMEDINLLLQTITTLPKLKCLHLLDFESSDLDGMPKVLFAHPTLLALKLKISRGVIDETMLRIIVSVPSLMDLAIETKESFAFPILFQSTSLRTLCISSGDKAYSFSDRHVMSDIGTLETNSTLHSLYLEPTMSCDAFKFLAQALCINNALDTLQVSLSGFGFRADQVLDELVRVLERNTSLKTLWNLQYDSFQVNQQSKDRLLQVMEINPTIKSCLFIDEDLDFQQRKEDLFKRRRGTFVESYFPQVIPNINTEFLCQHARWAKLGNAFKVANPNDANQCTDLMTSLQIFIDSLCKGANWVDDAEKNTTLRRSFAPMN